MSLKCIFFSEFHAEYGPRIVCQVPDNFISKEMFESVSVYVIPKPEIQQRVITNTIILDDDSTIGGLDSDQQRPSSTEPPAGPQPRGLKFIGYPNCISDRKYARNALIFNVCLVVPFGQSTLQFEPIVQKMSEWLVQMEQDCSLMSSAEGLLKIPDVLQHMLTQLNEAGRAVLQVDDGVPVHLKLVRTPPIPNAVEDEDVPVWLGPRPSRLDLWDMTSQQVIPHIHGVAHVAKIASMADVQVQLVKACVRNLLYYGLVELISIFQYSNSYLLTPRITQLYRDKTMLEDCALTVARDEGVPASLGGIFSVFCAMTHSKSMRDICAEFHMPSLRIDERKLVQYGLLKGIIRRVQKYPVKVCDATDSSTGGRFPDSVYQLFDGRHSQDAICVRTGVNCRETEEALERDSRVVVLWK